MERELKFFEVLELESVQTPDGEVKVRLHPHGEAWVLLTTGPGRSGDLQEGMLEQTLDGWEYHSRTGKVTKGPDWHPLIDQALAHLR